MKVLVTGAGGWLGGLVSDRLIAQNHTVRGLDVAYSGGPREGVEHVTGSVLDPDVVEHAMEGVDHVVHAAAIAHLWSPQRFDYDRVNVVGTCRVLAAARRAGARMVHVSSFTTLISSDTGRDDVLDETRQVVPGKLLGRYPRSKRQAELAVISAADAGQHACMVLPGAPVGVGDHNVTPPTRMIYDLANGRTPALLDCMLNLVDAGAVADAIVAALDRGAPGERYLLTGDDVPIKTVAEKIALLTGGTAPRFSVPLWVALTASRAEAALSFMSKKPPKAPLTGVRLAARPCRFDNTKAREALAFEPRPWEACLEESLGWLQPHNNAQG